MKFGLIVFVILCVTVTHADIETNGKCARKYPVVLIPGAMGSILHVNANIPSYVRLPRLCGRTAKNERFWLNFAKTLNFPCFSAYIRSNFSARTGTWNLLPGINFTVPKFGYTYAVDVLDPSGPAKYASPYYHDMINAFKKLGYSDGFNLAGAGYLWYDHPTDKWVNDLKLLIQKMYVSNAFKPVIVVAHSLGGPFSYYFFQKVGDDWIKTYVKKVIYIAPAFMGSVRTLESMFNGYDDIVPVVGNNLAPVCRNMPTVWMFSPWAEAFDANDYVALSPTKVYKFSQMAELLKDIGAPDVDARFLSTRERINKVINNYNKPLPVPVITHLGSGLDTAKTLIFYDSITRRDFDGDWPHADHHTCDGDGTVPLVSARYSTDKWARMGADITTYLYKGADHAGILKNSHLIDLIIKEAC